MTTKQPKPKLPKFEDNYSGAAYFAGITRNQAIQCDLALRDLCAGVELPWHNSPNPLVHAIPAKHDEEQKVQIVNLTMIVKRLVRHIENAGTPKPHICTQAMEYLTRTGLVKPTDVLR